MVVMGESARLLAKAFDDLEMYRRLLALMPWTVHCDHERRRASERATRMFARVPDQRREFARQLVAPVPSGRCYPWAG
jgi:hypothetical protein